MIDDVIQTENVDKQESKQVIVEKLLSHYDNYTDKVIHLPDSNNDWKSRMLELYFSTDHEAHYLGSIILYLLRPDRICRYYGCNSEESPNREKNAIDDLFYMSPMCCNPNKYVDKGDARWFKIGNFTDEDIFHDDRSSGYWNGDRTGFYDGNDDNMPCKFVECEGRTDELYMSSTNPNKADLQSCRELLTEYKESLQTCCFAANPYSSKLWKEHASNSCGFCVVYEKRDDNQLATAGYYYFWRSLFPMIYTENPIDISQLILECFSSKYENSISEMNLMRYTSILKNKEYYWENEWRFVTHSRGDLFRNISVIVPSRIILGDNISENYERKIRSIVEWRQCGVQFEKRE